jgi:predicted dehydrogenase
MKKEWAIKALQAGKHVVLEKPVGLSAAEFQEMLDVAYAQKKFILDGTMFAHHGRTDSVLECVSDEHKFGTVNRIESSFTFMTDAAFQESNIRARKDGDPQGCVGDLGWYCIRYAQLVFGKLGSKVKSAQVFENANTKHGVPFATTCIVRFEGVSVAYTSLSLVLKMTLWMTLTHMRYFMYDRVKCFRCIADSTQPSAKASKYVARRRVSSSTTLLFQSGVNVNTL